MNCKQLRNTLVLIIAAFLWGVTFVAQSMGAEHVGPFTFLAARSWVGSMALIPVIKIFDKVKPFNGNQAGGKRGLIVGGFICAFFIFGASAVQQAGIPLTSTAKAGFITSLYVLFVPLLSLFSGKSPGAKIWFCVLLGMAGLYLLCIKDTLSFSMGDSLMLLCALLCAVHILAVGRYSPGADPVRLSCVQFFFCAVFSTIGMIVFESPTWQGLYMAAIPILFAGIMSSGIAYTLQIIAQQDLNPTIASLAMCLESVFSALAGWAVLGQVLTGREMLGCVLMFAATVIPQFTKKQK